ncbi:MAG: hypothetical protein ACRCV6_10025 [Formosimonas sp.]
MLKGLLSLLLWVSLSALAQEQLPRFEDYPVAAVYTGKHHAAVITKANRIMRTRLRQAAQEPVNFAGHYVLWSYGCGTNCLVNSIVDVKTGLEFPDEVPTLSSCHNEDWTQIADYDIVARPNSRLLVVIGAQIKRGDDNGQCLARYYQEKNGRLLHIKTVAHPLHANQVN